jgi:hypothetical protein
MDKVQETSGSQCHIPSSKPFRILLISIFTLTLNILKLYVLQMSEFLHCSQNVIREINKKCNGGSRRHMHENLKYRSQYLLQQQQKQATTLLDVTMLQRCGSQEFKEDTQTKYILIIIPTVSENYRNFYLHIFI